MFARWNNRPAPDYKQRSNSSPERARLTLLDMRFVCVFRMFLGLLHSWRALFPTKYMHVVFAGERRQSQSLLIVDPLRNQGRRRASEEQESLGNNLSGSRNQGHCCTHQDHIERGRVALRRESWSPTSLRSKING